MIADVLLAQAPLILALIAYAVHNEHRLTTLEVKLDTIKRCVDAA